MAEIRDPRASQVALLDAAGSPVGLGVLVPGGRIVTCAHVVNAALGRPLVEPGRPDGVVTLVWPRLEGTAGVHRARTIAWLSLDDGDLAVLEPTTPLPAGSGPARLDPRTPAADSQLSVFGYPPGRVHGQLATVRAVGPVARGYLQINTWDPATPDVRSGYSGSPVHDRDGAVIGIVAQAPGHGTSRDSLVIPASRVLSFATAEGALPAATVGPGSGGASTDPAGGSASVARSGPPFEQLTVLHLSAPRFGTGRPSGGNRDRDRLFAHLHADLAMLARTHELRPDLVVVTGDLAERGLRSEFDEAIDFLGRLAEAVELPRSRVAVVPGSHDINRLASQQYVLGEQADEREPQKPYWPKWKHFIAGFEAFYGATGWPAGAPRPRFTEVQPWTLFAMPDLRVVVAGLNSTMAESHRDEDHYGWVGPAQLDWFADHLREYRDDGWLVLGAVHHGTIAGASEDDENLRDADDLDRILGRPGPGHPAGPGLLHLLLQGHPHDGRLHRLPSGLPALSTGRAAGAASARPHRAPSRYQLLTLRPTGITRHAREYLKDGERWTGDDRADPARNTWQHTGPVSLSAPAALAEPSVTMKDTGGRRTTEMPLGRPDVFLSSVEEVTRLRYPDAEITLNPASEPGLSYLMVTRRDEDGVIERWPVGAVLGSVDAVVLERFRAAVHDPLRSTDPNLRSRLVYGGEHPGDEVRREAVRAGVRLLSLQEYRQVIDLSRVRDEQVERLDRDSRYPGALYLRQRFRQQYPIREKDGEGRPAIEDDVLSRVAGWLGDDGARFVTVLGDFGRGKTFLLRQLVRELPARVGGVEPLLVELRTLDKGPDLYDIVGQHLRRLDVGDVTHAKVHHIIHRGAVALLLDGFDELVQRVTYPTAAAYLTTLLAAATGEAKIVLTSRSQHFSDDSQVRAALLESLSGRDVGRILVLEDFSDDQIREFLFRHYDRDGARTARRYRRLDDVKDLLGLSRNPRMLAFIADLPDARLDEAAGREGEIGAAQLYGEILDHWLNGEVERQKYVHGPAVLPGTERLAACRTLARRIWSEGNAETVGTDELRAIAETLGALEQLKFSADEAGHTIGSSSLLTRTDDGFGFVHRSIMEWLVADAAAAAVRSGEDPADLAAAEMSDLMTDFFCDLVGPAVAATWARATLGTSDARSPLRANATRVRARLTRRGIAAKAVEPTDAGPLDLSRQDLRDQDLAALAATRGDGGPNSGLRGASLVSTVLSGLRIGDVDLAGADLSYADLRETHLTGTDLTGARLLGADAEGARLSGVNLSGADLTGTDLRRTRLVDVDLSHATIQGSRWTASAVLGGSVPAAIRTAPEWHAAAVAGRDDATAQLRRLGGGSGLAVSDALGLVAVPRGSAVQLLDLDQGRPIRTLTGHTGPVSAVAFGSIGGQTVLATGSHDGTARLWDPVTGQALRPALTGHTGPVSAVAFGSIGGRSVLATGSHDGTVRLWATVTGRPIDRTFRHTDAVLAVALGQVDDEAVLASSDRGGTLQLWDPATGVGIGPPLPGHVGPVRAVTFGQLDGRTVLISGGDDGEVGWWHPTTGAPLGRATPHPADKVTAVAVGQLEGRTVLASSSDDGSLWVWDPFSAGLDRRIWAGREGRARWVAFGVTRGRTVLVSSSSTGTVRLWDPVVGTPSGQPPTGYTGKVSDLTFGPFEGRPVLASISNDEDDRIRLWDPATGVPVGGSRTGFADSATTVAIGQLNGRTLVAGSDDEGTVQVRDLATSRHLGPPRVGGRGPATALALGQVERRSFVAGSYGDSFLLWDLAASTGKPLEARQHSGPVTALALGMFGSRPTLAVGGHGQVRLRELRPDMPTHQALTGHTGWIRTLAFGVVEGQNVLASGDDDGSVRVWDPVRGSTLGQSLPGHRGGISSVRFGEVEGHTILAGGSEDGTVRLWDPATGILLVGPLTGHTGGVRAVAFGLVQGRTVLASGGDDGTVRLWLVTHSPPGPESSFLKTGLRFSGSRTRSVPRLHVHLLGTLTGSWNGWAMLSADEKSYKAGGDAPDLLWWAIKTCRFGVGELDPHVDGIRALPHHWPILPPIDAPT
jgi:WD40 repeat protein/uncharacterized protein YjbI with pentapeptide repeats/3',5'-cyclic AMP phosphodiesterase CpdA